MFFTAEKSFIKTKNQAIFKQNSKREEWPQWAEQQPEREAGQRRVGLLEEEEGVLQPEEGHHQAEVDHNQGIQDIVLDVAGVLLGEEVHRGVAPFALEAGVYIDHILLESKEDILDNAVAVVEDNFPLEGVRIAADTPDLGAEEGTLDSLVGAGVLVRWEEEVLLNIQDSPGIQGKVDNLDWEVVGGKDHLGCNKVGLHHVGVVLHGEEAVHLH